MERPVVGAAARPSRASTPPSRRAPARRRCARGGGSCDGYHVSTNGTRSPGSHRRTRRRCGSPRPTSSTGVREQSASGPAIGEHARRRAGAPTARPRRSRSGCTSSIRIRTRPLDALDDAHDVGRLAARRHEVDQPDGALGASRARSRGPACRRGSGGGSPDLARRARAPAAVLGVAERAPRSRRPSRSAGSSSQSIDPSRRDERRRLEVADERVVLDALGHARTLARAG